MRVLDIWMNGLLVGQWHQQGRTASRLVYAPSWVEHPQGRPLSLSLPMTGTGDGLRGAVVDNYFDNLLPDNEVIRRRVGARFKATSLDAFTLLQSIGRDSAGAVQLLPEGAAPQDVKSINGRALTEAEVAEHLRGAILSTGDSSSDDFRFSLAGAQEKTALLWHKGSWHIPQGATPTTHILKLPLGLAGNTRYDLQHSIENEWLSMELLRAMGLPIAKTQMAQFEDQRVLIVERFDRHVHPDGWIVRIPHEDLLQAQGLPSHLKYESDGGPGVSDIMGLLRGSANVTDDRQTFFKALLYFWLLAAVDGHAKNFSIAIAPGGTFKLAPLYDVLSAWPWVGSGANHVHLRNVKMAMALRTKNTHYRMNDIYRRHWLRVGEQYVGVEPTMAILGELPSIVESAITAVQELVPEGFPVHIADTIFEGVRSNLARLAL
ncbi:type II toxin-antitoxin system HipA family toxin [Paenalcaligenes sp. Me52]|uniref:type II toxin-antitoxin system HipA family toxin n=1 Tax=Paenalcaligenes sp. Me52 TaxID=3392038 RepID=UPI003D2E7720